MRILLSALSFPFLRGNRMMFGCLVGLHLFCYALAIVPVLGWVLSLAILGYIYATYFQIIYTTGMGYEDAPDFPDFSNPFDHMLVPLLKVLVIYLLSFAPSFLYLSLSDFPEQWIALSLMLIGLAYLPMGMMIAALDDLSKAMNPVVVIQGIRQASPIYWLMTTAIFGFHLLRDSFDLSPAAFWLVSAFLGAYGVMFEARIIGSVYEASFDNSDLTSPTPEATIVDP